MKKASKITLVGSWKIEKSERKLSGDGGFDNESFRCHFFSDGRLVMEHPNSEFKKSSFHYSRTTNGINLIPYSGKGWEVEIKETDDENLIVWISSDGKKDWLRKIKDSPNHST